MTGPLPALRPRPTALAAASGGRDGIQQAISSVASSDAVRPLRAAFAWHADRKAASIRDSEGEGPTAGGGVPLSPRPDHDRHGLLTLLEPGADWW